MKHCAFTRRTALGMAFGLLTGVASVPAIAESASAPASAPASRPADQIVLVRLDDRATVTQEDFNNAVKVDPDRGYMIRTNVIRELVQDRQIWLYAQDHPDLVTQEDIDKRIAYHIKMRGFDSIEQAAKFYEAHGLKWDSFVRFTHTALAKARLVTHNQELVKDDDRLKQVFEDRKNEFDGTYAKARQIFFRLPVYATPEQRKAVKDRLFQMRRDLLDGKRTWAQCVAESDSAPLGGDMGQITRHLKTNETLAGEIFKLQPGQLSDVIETILGYHLVQVQEFVTPTDISWEYLKERMIDWLRNEPTALALAESNSKYPIIGVQAPLKPPPKPTSFPTPPAKLKAAASRAASSRPTRVPVFQGDTRRPTHTRPATRTKNQPKPRHQAQSKPG